MDQHVLHLGAAIAIVGGLISLCDFLEKVGPFTTIAMLASAFGLAVAFVLYKAGYLSANFGRNACLALLLMLGGSASVKAAQSFIPGASENGVIAQVVPGASALQNTMLSSLGRIEEQTKRVSDILEDNARREQAVLQAEQEAQHTKVSELKSRIAEGGYSLDEAGYLSAAKDRFRYLQDFAQVGIKITEAGLRDFLAKVDDNKTLLDSVSFSPRSKTRARRFERSRRITATTARKCASLSGAKGPVPRSATLPPMPFLSRSSSSPRPASSMDAPLPRRMRITSTRRTRS